MLPFMASSAASKLNEPNSSEYYNGSLLLKTLTEEFVELYRTPWG